VKGTEILDMSELMAPVVRRCIGMDKTTLFERQMLENCCQPASW
jgi:hypothetical protein